MNEFIKELLRKSEMKQSELAQILGISAAAVNQWKSTENIKPEILYSLSKLFSISVDNLLLEKFNDETIEEKCDRLYNIDGDYWGYIISENDQELLLDFSCKLRNINERVYELLYLKMLKKIKEQEKIELEYLNKYMECNVFQSQYFKDLSCFMCLDEDRDMKVAQKLCEYIDIQDKETFMWELKKIYSCKEKIVWEQVQAIKELLNEEILTNIFLSYTEFERDCIATQYSAGFQFYLDDIEAAEKINCMVLKGANILYTQRDFSMLNFGKEELEKFEGKKIALTELNEVKALLDNLPYDIQHWGRFLEYQDYKKLINHKRMNRFKHFKYIESNPIKYWEYIKTEEYYL